ncbi:hypothetical protein Y032_0137g2030 [Ancylostoma ceylanicum]|uniref:Uncharacterized protein n=1 Tax=Ancylostoma ceylanicum TaxID=53326 RepID=A0A016T4Z7_9BILA|nr:hypothetical protein Y032_0137g2030 [Ancylostoma ceylanicum]
MNTPTPTPLCCIFRISAQLSVSFASSKPPQSILWLLTHNELQTVVGKKHIGFPPCLFPTGPLPRCSRQPECPRPGPAPCLRPFGVPRSCTLVR